jgi:diguanylate cyclase (GGDEF)-like protein/PAS domain S-box-containing protein
MLLGAYRDLARAPYYRYFVKNSFFKGGFMERSLQRAYDELREMTWRAFGAVMLPVIALYFFIPDLLAQSLAYDVIGAVTIMVMAVGLRRNRPTHQTPWVLLIGGMTLALGGDVLWTLHDVVAGGDPPFPWYADGIYLASYPVLAAGVLALLHARQPGGNRAALLDALIVAVGLGAGIWVFLIAPYLRDETLTRFEQVVAMAYPVMDLVLLLVAARLLTAGGLNHPSILLLLGGLWCFLIGDAYYVWAVLNDRYHSGDLVDATWLVANVAMCMALLHPSARTADQPAESPSPAPLSLPRLALLSGIGLAGPVVLAVRQLTTTDGDTMVLIIASAALFILALLRVGALTQDLGHALDERTEAQRELTMSEARFRGAFAHAPIGMALVDRDGHWHDVNQALCVMLGYPVCELRGVAWWALVHPDDVESTAALVANPGSRIEPRERRYVRQDGHVVWTIQSSSALPDTNGSSMMIWQFQDISAQKQLEQELRRLSLTDPLTSLPNRALFADRLDHALSSKRSDECVAVLFIDLDRFKAVNDRLGHRQGDLLLQAVAARLAATLAPPNTVARFGGDEFVAILESLSDPSDATTTVEALLRTLREPFHLDGAEVGVDASIGVAVGWPGRSIAEDLLRHADLALYRAKAMGRATYAIFDAGLDAEADRRQTLENDLRRAIDRREFVVHYQPIVDMLDRRIVGAEALVRWNHPVRGLVAPAEFIDLAEDTGLIVPLGTQVFEAACREATGWATTAGSNGQFTLNVNVSSRQFHEAEFVATVRDILNRTGFPANRLRLELTERSLIEESPSTIETVRALSDMGLSLAIDDFGIGYSSLTSLRYLPVGTVKIDRTFIRGLDETPGTKAIVEAIVALAHALELDVTAEGIESEEQYDQVRLAGCAQAQGYLLGRPVPGNDFARIVGAQFN